LKRVIYILLFCWPAYIGYGQVVAVQADKMNILYLGIYNPLTIAAENTSSKSIIVTTDNGEINIDSFRSKGGYNIIPAKVGIANIYVKKKIAKGLKTIGHTIFRVKRMPLPLPSLSEKHGGEIPKALLCVQIAPAANMTGLDIDGKYPIVSFTVVILRHNREIFSRKIANENGARIDSVTNKFFYKLHNNDVVIFKDIAIRDFDHSIQALEKMEFTITEAKKYHKIHRPKHGEETITDPVTGAEVIKKW